MRILVVSDLHYRLPHYDWLVGRCRARRRRRPGRRPGGRGEPGPARRPDRGVDKYLGLLAERTRVLRRVRQPRPRRARRARGAGGLLAARGSSGAACTWTGRASTSATPGSPSVPGGTVRSTRAEVAAQLAAAAVDRPARWVWLYHAPPAGTVLCQDGRRSSRTRTSRTGSREHQPDVVLCGHIHQAPWAEGGSWHARLGRHLGVQRRQGDRAGAAAHHPRHRGAARPTGSASSSRGRSSLG